jgi:hypothetical protein
MTAVDSESDAGLGVQDAFGHSKLQSSSRLQGETNPVFRVGLILAGAHLQCVVSSLRLTLKATDRLARAQAKLLGQGELSEPQEFSQHLRTVVDEARSSLGDIAEMASQELRQLQRRLNDLQETTRRLVPEASTSEGPYRRRWKAKL